MKMFAATASLTLTCGLAVAAREAAVLVVFPSKQAAQVALPRAQEIIVGTLLKDTAGCLYSVAAEGQDLVLVPVVVDGDRICAPTHR